jgi:diketogulonate reductase-like aldo/keto reductase
VTSSVPDVVLNNGVSMPQLGFGVFRVPQEETERAVLDALETGYRSIDTASLYGNETGVGRALTSSGLAREDLFVATKVWNDDQGYDSTLRACDVSLGRLGLEHVDLYLIHWPKPSLDRYVETWRALEKLYTEGRVRAIGVSNFQPDHLRRLLDETEIVPAVNQIELHPDLQQEQLRRFHAEHGVVTEAWSPLGQGLALRHPAVVELARRHGRTPAQVVLRWHVQLGNVAIPKSTTLSRIRENVRVFDFALTEADMAALTALETGTRLGPDPDERDTRRRSGFSSAGGQWVS